MLQSAKVQGPSARVHRDASDGACADGSSASRTFVAIVITVVEKYRWPSGNQSGLATGVSYVAGVETFEASRPWLLIFANREYRRETRKFPKHCFVRNDKSDILYV